MPACTIEFPVSVGDIVNVKITSLLVSLRKNSNTRYMKLSVRAYWLEQWFDPETGDEEDYFEIEKYFTFPVSAIGSKVAIDEKGGIK